MRQIALNMKLYVIGMSAQQIVAQPVVGRLFDCQRQVMVHRCAVAMHDVATQIKLAQLLGLPGVIAVYRAVQITVGQTGLRQDEAVGFVLFLPLHLGGQAVQRNVRFEQNAS